MKKEMDRLTALKKARSICSKMEKCKEDIRQKLYEWKLDSKEHDWIIESLEIDKFIDETRFVSFYVQDKFKFNKWGKIKIEYELKAKHISGTIIKEALKSIDEDAYKKVCENLLNQKLKNLEGEEHSKIREKLIRYGLSRGFEPDLIYAISEKLLNLR